MKYEYGANIYYMNHVLKISNKFNLYNICPIKEYLR